MKKVFAILAITALFAACNNEAETGMSTEDSIRRADSIRDANLKDSLDRAMKDTMNMGDTMNKMPADTAAKK